MRAIHDKGPHDVEDNFRMLSYKFCTMLLNEPFMVGVTEFGWKYPDGIVFFQEFGIIRPCSVGGSATGSFTANG